MTEILPNSPVIWPAEVFRGDKENAIEGIFEKSEAVNSGLIPKVG